MFCLVFVYQRIRCVPGTIISDPYLDHIKLSAAAFFVQDIFVAFVRVQTTERVGVWSMHELFAFLVVPGIILVCMMTWYAKCTQQRSKYRTVQRVNIFPRIVYTRQVYPDIRLKVLVFTRCVYLFSTFSV